MLILHVVQSYSLRLKVLNINYDLYRFESITFQRTKKSAEKTNEMQQRTGLVEA